ALKSQHRETERVMEETGAVGMVDMLMSFITAASFTKEAITILTGQKDVPPESARVKELALEAGASEELLAKIGQLCGGSHPAAPVLARVRNKVGFHWDPVEVSNALADFRTNQYLVWAEARDQMTRGFVYRLAADVLANAILPGEKTEDGFK